MDGVGVDTEGGEFAVGDMCEEAGLGRFGLLAGERCQSVQRGGVAEFDGAGDGVDAGALLDSPGYGLVVRQHFEQDEGVARLRGEDDATPEAGDPDRTDVGVARVAELLDVQPGVGQELFERASAELLPGVEDPLLHLCLKLVQFGAEADVEG